LEAVEDNSAKRPDKFNTLYDFESSKHLETANSDYETPFCADAKLQGHSLIECTQTHSSANQLQSKEITKRLSTGTLED